MTDQLRLSRPRQVTTTLAVDPTHVIGVVVHCTPSGGSCVVFDTGTVLQVGEADAEALIAAYPALASSRVNEERSTTDTTSETGNAAA